MLIFVSSPYRGATDIETAQNIVLAKDACRFALSLGKTPVCAHLLYPRFLDDKKEDERETGLQCALDLLNRCDELWMFTHPEQEITEGMRIEAELAVQNKIPIKMLHFHKEGGFISAR